MPTTSTTAVRTASQKWVRVFAWGTFLLVLLLIFFGGMVKSTNAGLSVPDWPNTYGHFMFSFPLDRMVGGVFWEHSHRMIASVAGLLTFILTIVVYRFDDRVWLRRLCLAASILVIVQGVLGGATVLFGLPVWISSTHGTIAQIYFCMLFVIALALSPAWKTLRPLGDLRGIEKLKKLSYALIGVIMIQLMLGAVMRHMEAGLVIPDFPMMFGSWTPPLSDEAIEAANVELQQYEDRDKILMPTTVERHHMLIHLAHRTWAFVVLAIGLWTVAVVSRRHRSYVRLNRAALIFSFLLLAQVTLGILTIYTTKNPTMTTFHVTVGALLLAAAVAMATTATRLSRWSTAGTSVDTGGLRESRGFTHTIVEETA